MIVAYFSCCYGCDTMMRCRFLDESPDGVVYAVMCFAVRFVEALGAAALLTSSFAIIANTFPDRVATMFVRRFVTAFVSLFTALRYDAKYLTLYHFYGHVKTAERTNIHHYDW